MSEVIDNKIVEMQFDNADFEKNVQDTLKTLERLQKELNFAETAKNFAVLGDAASKVDFSKLNDNIQTIADRFTVAGIASKKIIEDLTSFVEKKVSGMAGKVKSMVSGGGLNRAFNIEKAKFQLEGLGIAWKDIVDDINYGVKDTAYGLDAAANVASQLVASGISVGEEMQQALRGVSGVAAMTNSSYEEIGHVFTTVAGQGKVMTMQLRQLENRGLNAAATIAQQMGVTEDAVREMVTKGQIDFKTFAKAMNEAFGDHAKDANRTFQGVVSNIKAAFSRIGAEFYSPLIANDGPLVTFLESIRVSINNLHKALTPAIGDIVEFIVRILEMTQRFGHMFTYLGGWTAAWEALGNILNSVASIIGAVLLGIKDVVPTLSPKALVKAVRSFRDLTSQLVLTQNGLNGLYKIGQLVGHVLNIIGTVLGQIVKLLSPLVPIIFKIVDGMLTVVSVIDYLIEPIATLVANTLKLYAIEPLIQMFKAFGEVLGDAFGKVLYAAAVSVYLLVKGVMALASAIRDFIKGPGAGVKRTMDEAVGPIEKIRIAISGLLDKLSNINIVEFATAKFNKFKETMSGFMGVVSTNIHERIEKISASFKSLISNLKGLRGVNFEETITNIKDFAKVSFRQSVDGLKDYVARLKSLNIVDAVSGKLRSFGSIAKGLGKSLTGSAAADKIGEIFSKISEIGIVKNAVASFNGFVESAKNMAATISGSVVERLNAFVAKVSEIEVVKKVSGYVSAFIDKLKPFSTVISDTVVGKFNSTVDFFKNLAAHAREVAGTNIGGVLQFFKELANISFDKVVTTFNNFKTALGEYITKIRASATYNAIVTKMATVFNKVSVALQKLIPLAKTLAMIVGGVSYVAIQAIVSALKQIPSLSFENVVNGLKNLKNVFFSLIEGIKNIPAVRLITDIASGISSTIGGLVANLQPVIQNVGSVFSNFIGLFRRGSSEVEVGAQSIENATTSVTRALGGDSSSGGVSGAVAIFQFVVGKLKDAFRAVNTVINELVPGLNLAKILVAGFVISITKSFLDLIKATTTVAESVKTTVDSVGGIAASMQGMFNGWKAVPEKINEVLDSFKQKAQVTIGEQIRFVAESIAILAASLWLIAQIPEEDLLRSGVALGALAIGVWAFSLVLSAISKIEAKNNMAKFALSIIGVAAGIFILVGALKMMEALKVSVTQDQIIALIGLAGLVSALVIVVSAFPIQKGLGGALAIIAVAYAFKQAVASFIELCNLAENLKNAQQAVGYIAIVMGALAALTFAVGRMKFSSAAGLVLVLATLSLIELVLVKVAESSYLNVDYLMAHLQQIAIAFGILAVVMLTAGLAGQYAARGGVAMLLIAGAVAILGKVVEQIVAVRKNTIRDRFDDVIMGISLMLTMMAVLMMTTALAGKDAPKAALAIAVIMGVFALMINFIKHVIESTSGIDQAKILGGILVISICVGALIGITKLTEKAKVGPILALSLIIAELVAALTLLSVVNDTGGLLSAAVSLGLVLAALGYALTGVSKITEKVKVMPIIAMIGACATIVVALSMMTRLLDNWPMMLAAGAALSLCMVAFSKALQIASEAKIKGAFAMLLAMPALLATAIGLTFIATQPWQQILAAGGALSATMMLIGAALRIANGGLKGAAILLLAIPTIIATALSLAILATQPWEQVLTAATSLGITLIMLDAAIGIASSAGFKGAFVLLAGMIPVVGIALSLAQLAQYPWEQITAAAIALNATVIILVAAVGVLGALVSAGIGVVGIVALVVVLGSLAGACLAFAAMTNGFAAAVNAVVNALNTLAGYGTEQLDAIRTSMTSIGSAIGEGLATMIIKFVSTIKEAIMKVVKSAITTIKSYVPSFKSIGAGLISSFIGGIISLAGGVLKSVGSLALSAAKSLSGGNVIAAVVTSASNFITGFAQTVRGGFSKVKDICAQFGSKAIEGLTSKDGIDSHSPSLKAILAALNMILGFTDTVEDGAGQAESAGGILGSGGVRGLFSKVGDFFKAGASSKAAYLQGLGGAISSNISKAIESGVELPKGFDELKNGITNAANKALEKVNTKGLGTTVKEVLGNLVPGMKDFVDEGFDWHNLVPDALKEAVEGASSAGAGAAGAGAAGAGAGGGSASKEVKKSTEIIDYAAGVVEKYKEKYGELYEQMGKTDALSASKDAVTEFAKAVYEASGKSVEAAENGIADVLENFKSFREGLESNLKTQLSSYSEFKQTFDTTSKTMLKGLDSNKKAVNDWIRYLKLAASKGIDKETLINLASAGFSQESYNQVRNFATMTENEVDDFNYKLQNKGQTAKEMTDGLLSDLVGIYAAREGQFEGVNDKFLNSLDRTYLQTVSTLESVQMKYDSVQQSLEETLKNAISHFTEFKESEDSLSISDILENEKSQIKAMNEWEQNIQRIMEADIAPEFADYLMNMGYQQGYGYAKALAEGTDEEIEEVSRSFMHLEGMAKTRSEDIASSYAVKFTENAAAAFKKLGELAQSGEVQAELANAAIKSMDVFWQGTSDANKENREKYTNYLSEGVTQILDNAIIEKLGGTQYAPKMTAVIVSSMTSSEAKDAVSAGAAECMKTAADAMVEAAENNSEVAEKIENAGSLIPTLFANSILKSMQLPSDKAGEMSEGVVTTVEGIITYEKFKEISDYVIQGLVDGIYDGKYAVLEAFRDMCREAVEVTEDEWDTHSPSRVSYRFGAFWDMGIANAIRDKSGEVIGSAEDLSAQTVDSFAAMMEHISTFMDGDLDVNPVITPVYDMSNIQLGMNQTRDLLNETFKMATINDGVLDIAASMRARDEAASDDSSRTANYNFVQNNYSPKALSRLDIYRQTKNQFARMKGLVET